MKALLFVIFLVSAPVMACIDCVQHNVPGDPSNSMAITTATEATTDIVARVPAQDTDNFSPIAEEEICRVFETNDFEHTKRTAQSWNQSIDEAIEEVRCSDTQRGNYANLDMLRVAAIHPATLSSIFSDMTRHLSRNNQPMFKHLACDLKIHSRNLFDEIDQHIRSAQSINELDHKAKLERSKRILKAHLSRIGINHQKTPSGENICTGSVAVN